MNQFHEVAQIAYALRLPPDVRPALERLAEVRTSAAVRLPAPAETDDLLARLGVAEADRSEIVAARPSLDKQPALWWLLNRCHSLLVNRMGTVGALDPWPVLSRELGPAARYLYVWVFLATVEHVRRYHLQRGIPDDLSWRVLATLGVQMANYRALYGEGGLHTQDWLTFHFRGAVYALGGLHFERQRIWCDVDRQSGVWTVPRRGDHALGLHIPEGSLAPDMVEDALHRARGFFARHFPDEDHRFATCVSWLLDEQLQEYLSPASNILTFQRRFHLIPSSGSNDNATLVEFLFKRPLSKLDALPSTTTLQRAVIGHIRAGRTWTFRTGWFVWGA
ncbi:acyltransferase domain-containing protein [Micromonospora yasonensis]|uniref:acyltransferase domain-containing protein n=1 Tax=Micromonospora yasonensis TaxID=1128667 RepID=UPI00222F62F5|nr:acyltransferase domain-containing protein [Micromonospora yasonensis]MCW3844131.1 acyltransferase domain-containing protein [Micromonospora yasonensis]